MADGSYPSLVSKDRDVNAITNPIYTQLTNGTAVVDVTAGALDVNIDNASLVVTATDLDIRDLTHVAGQDSVQVGDGTNLLDLVVINSAYGATPVAAPVAGKYEATPTTYDDGDAVPLLTDAEGRLQVDVIGGGGGGTEYVEDAVAVTATGPAILAERDDVLAGITPIEGDWSKLYVNANGALWVTVDGSVAVTATDLDIRDLTHVSDSVSIGDGTDTLAVNTDGSINVNLVSASIGGEVHNYDTAATVASDATDTHTYTATGGTFLWKSAIWSGSGNVKAELQDNAVTFAVGFLTGRQGDTKQLFFDPPVEVTDTQAASIIRTNRQGQATDVYSSIIGIQL